MPHIDTFFDPSEYIAAYELQGKDVHVTIEGVKAVEVYSEKKNKNKLMPAISFKGKKKKLLCNKTNKNAIVKRYGTNTDDWQGCEIVLYPTTCKVAGQTVECIRIR